MFPGLLAAAHLLFGSFSSGYFFVCGVQARASLAMHRFSRRWVRVEVEQCRSTTAVSPGGRVAYCRQVEILLVRTQRGGEDHVVQHVGG